ncbi:conserved hypothetical protein [Neospora caninum Liverpool]|uniref:Uncharacterized protein n=1 Tax=Neospora caninum (strain Liverpool) TaxID=572307 RepID=F0VA76_NEOCL|nr:conserved hypothetical protein [Neospora caninum Liverpool]CBZ50565.1 conserved hypothetical protein [Neospora caninum Liverpool]|eukprot:XP_003880598.1 conserved hypothetical protein [Neospora caninum Liverpool]
MHPSRSPRSQLGDLTQASLVHALEKPDDDDFRLVLPPSPAALRRTQEEASSDEEEDTAEKAQEEGDGKRQDRRTSMRERLSFFRGASLRRRQTTDAHGDSAASGFSSSSLKEERADAQGKGVEGEARRDAEIAKKPSRSLLLGFGSKGGRGEKSRSGSRALDGPPPGEDPIAREDRQPETGTASVTVHQEEPTVVAASVDSGERQSNPDERDETQVSPEGRGNPFSASSDLDEPERGECASSREGQARANVHAKKGEQTPGGVKSVLKRPETSESKLGLGAPYRRSISFKHLSGSSSGDEEDRSIGGDSEDRKGERDGQRREADAPLLHRRSTVRWSELVEEKGNGGDEEEGSGGSAEHEASGPRGLRDRRKSSLFVGKATDWEEREDDSFSRATRESVAGEEGNSRGLGTADDAPQQRLAGDPHQVYRHPTGREDGAPETIPSSPSYLFTHASSLHQLLQLPPAKYFNLTAEIQRQRSIFPRRWVDETLLIHQSLLLFCASLRPLCVRIMVPLSNVQAVALLDVNLRERDRRKATKRGWRLKLLHTETSQRGKGKVQEIVCRFKQENDMHTWAERLTLLAQKWRQRPAVPDLLYRPPCQTQLDEVSRDIHKAASTLLVQRIFFACCAAARSQYRLFFFSARLYCLQKLRRESELRIQRTASAACRAAAQREGACRLQLVLEKKLRLHFWDLCQQSERIHLHTVQKKRLAVAVALLEKEEEAVARHITHWRKRSLVLILSAALARRLSWAVTQLGVATKLAAARAKQKSAGALYLEEVLRRYEQRRLRGAFAVLRRETRRRGEQGKKLKLVVDTLRKQRLAVAWQRLVQFYIASAKTQARKVEQAKGMALELSLLAVEKKRVASAFFKLKEHAHASREDEREAVCRNMEKVNETLRTAALRVPRQRGFLVLSAVVRKVQRSLLLSSFSLWTGTLRRESRKKTALVRVARVIEQKERRMKEVGLSSLFRWGHFANEQLCRKRAGASLLAASLSSISRRILGSAWGKLTIHGEDRPFERELKGVFVLEKIRRRRLQFFFTQLQREAACGRDLRVFLKSHVLHAFVHLLALRRVKILSTSFQRLRSFSSRASSQTRASSRTCLAQRPSPPPLDPLHLPQAARSLPVSPRRESFDRSKTGAREILASRSLIEGRQIAEESRETRLAEGVAVSPSSPYLLPTKRLIPLPACDPPQRSPFPSSSFSASTAPPFSSSLVFGHTDAFLPSPETEATMDRIHDLLRLSGDLLEQQEKLFSSHSEAESPPVVPRVAPVPGLATPSLSRVSGGTETESRSREETVSMDAPKKAEKRRESGKKPGGNARATEETPKKKEKKTVTRRSSASAKALGLAESGGEASRAKGCLFRTSASMDSVFLDSGNQAAGRSAVPIVPPVGILVSSASTEQLPGLLSPRSLRLPSPFNLDDAPLFACSPSPIQEDGSSSWGFAPCRAPLPLGVDDAGTRTSGPTAASPRLAVSLSGPVSFHRTGDFPSGALGNRRLLAPPSGILVFEETRETSREAPVFGFTQNPKNFRDQDREIDALIDHLQRKLGFPTETSQHSWIVDSADSNPQSFVSPSSPFFNPSVSLPFCPASASPSLYPHSGPVEQGALRVSPAVSAVRTLERPRSADTERKKGLFSVLNSLSPCASPLSRCCGFVSGESPEKKPMERPQARDSPADAAALPRKITSSASRVRFVDTTGATLEQRQGDGTCSSSASFPFCTDFSSPCSSLKSFSGFSPETQNLDTLPAGAWVPVHAASLGYAAPRVHATASQKSGKKKVSSLAKRPAVDAPAHAVDASPGVLSPGGVRGFRFARGT